VNASQGLKSKILFEEFIVGTTSSSQNMSDEDSQTLLDELKEDLRTSYDKMFEKYPFLFMSAQNCSDMIVSIGNYVVIVRLD
jgi:hypothetical protein